MGGVNALRSWISPGSAACRTLHSYCRVLLSFMGKSRSVSSLGVAELLKMCSALYVWVILNSPSRRAVRSAITQDSRSDSEQSMDICSTKSCFMIPSLLAAQTKVHAHLKYVWFKWGLVVVTELKQTGRKRILFGKKAPEVLCPVFFCWHFSCLKNLTVWFVDPMKSSRDWNTWQDCLPWKQAVGNVLGHSVSHLKQ